MKNNIILSVLSISLIAFSINANAGDNTNPTRQINLNLQSVDVPLNEKSTDIKKESSTTQKGLENDIVKNDITKNSKVQNSVKEYKEVEFEFNEAEEITFRDIEPVILLNYPEVQEVVNDRIQKIIDASNYGDRRLIKEINEFRELLEKQHKIISFINDKMVNVDQTNELYDKNLILARWVIVIVSMGSVLLMLIIYLIWRGVVNVNKNEMEVVFAYEDIKKKFLEVLDQVEFLNEQVNGRHTKKGRNKAEASSETIQENQAYTVAEENKNEEKDGSENPTEGQDSEGSEKKDIENPSETNIEI